MEKESILDFIRDFRKSFETFYDQKETGYLDLGMASDCTPEQLLRSRRSFPAENPLFNAVSSIITALKNGQLAHARLGINELLQLFLSRREQDSSCPLTGEMFLESLYLIVLYITQDGFPFENYFFEYLLRCYQPVCSFLISEKREEDIALFMEHITSVGKIAAQRQMDTCSIHHLLRNIETFAAENGIKDLETKAKDNRHTLEI